MKKSMKEFKEKIYSDLVKERWAAGSYFGYKGAAVEPLCLPKNPQYGDYDDGGRSNRQLIYGAEYYTGVKKDNDVPCALCHAKGQSVVRVIPAMKDCFEGWTKEYSGFLMSGFHTQSAGTTFTCVDENPEAIQGGSKPQSGYYFAAVEARCGSLKCPPYGGQKAFTCVVCSAP